MITLNNYSLVATVLTACGIETWLECLILKVAIRLQQYLPLAVLKLDIEIFTSVSAIPVATVLTACGIETTRRGKFLFDNCNRCNSTYRLQY